MTDERGSPRLSVVVPFFDEGENVDRLLDELQAALASSPWPWEAVLVDDGSRDDTLDRLKALGYLH